MTIDRTLKSHSSLKGTRSVLTRAERIARLADEGEFNLDEDSPLGLRKVRVRTSKAGTKKKEAPKEEAAAAEAEGAAEAKE